MTMTALVIAVTCSPRVNAWRAVSSSAAPSCWDSSLAAATAPPRVSRAACAALDGIPSGMEPAMARR